jgi:NDP-sugar pyrophosphorylase family protein
MQALILAGGAGTRLRSVLAQLNKPMAPVAGRPFLEYLFLQLKKHKVEEVTLCVGYKADLIQSYFGTGDRWGMQVSYSYETDFRGTAGALKLAENLIHEENFFVMNGDSLFDIEFHALMHYHRDMKAIATLALVHVDDTQRYGAVGLNKLGRIVSFTEKRQGNTEGLINGGVYVFAQEVLDFIPEGQPVSLEKDLLPKLIGQNLYGLPSKGYFVDIGVPTDYMRLQSNPTQLLAAVDQRRYSSCSFEPRHR